MKEIKLEKRFPHIKDEDVTSIFQEGYIKGFENGRKGAIPIEWIERWWRDSFDLESQFDVAPILELMIRDWEKENE